MPPTVDVLLVTHWGWKMGHFVWDTEMGGSLVGGSLVDYVGYS